MNTNFEIKGDIAIIKINKEIYPKEVLIQAAYIKLEKYYILIDTDENYFIVSLKYKEKNQTNNLESSVYEFFDELIESQSYIDQIERTSKIREIILERALLGQTLDDEIIESLNSNQKNIENENLDTFPEEKTNFRN